MQTRVGPLTYDVRLVAGYIRHEGEDCLGLCDNEQQLLLVSDRTTPAQRVAVFCHEYMEAWVYHFASNDKNKENLCDLFGLAMTQFVEQFAPSFEINDTIVPYTQQNAAPQPSSAISTVPRMLITEHPPHTSDDGQTWRIKTIEPA